jgi:non-specific serine/threonine protein kinase
VARELGDLDAAKSHLERSRGLYQELGNKRGLATVLSSMGFLAAARGQLHEAKRLQEQALTLRREVGDQRGIALSLNALGWVMLLLGEAEQSANLCRAGLAAFGELGDRWGLSQFIPVLVGALLRVGNPDRSVRLLGAAEALREALGVPMPPYARPEYERLVDAARAAVGGSGRFDAIHAEGRTMSASDLLAYALPDANVDSTRDTKSARSRTLSAREVEVATLVAQGLTNPQIATRLVISERTVDAHVAHIMDKLGVRARSQIATWAVGQGLARPVDADQRRTAGR